MPATVLVLGGTGLLGEPVVRRLRADGIHVRVLSRDPEGARQKLGPTFEVVQGDVHDPETVRLALDGCAGVHISVAGSGERVAAEVVARLAPAAEVEWIGYVSGSTVDEANGWFPMVADKLTAERAVAGSGVPWTVFRATWPFETLTRFVRGGRAGMIGRHPTPYHFFAADDFARMVSAAFTTPEAAGKHLYIHGPEPIGMHDALDRYRAALHPEIEKISSMPTWMGRLMAAATRNDQLRYASRLMAYFERVGEPGDPAEANRLLGAPTTTMDEWIAARLAARAAMVPAG
jgi:uncharacterized protein YbjT (DUF2867 family)